MAKLNTDFPPVSGYAMAVRVGSCTGWLLVTAAVPCLCSLHETVAYPGILFGVGVQQIQLRTEDRENGDLGAVVH